MEDGLTPPVRVEDENAALRAILEGTATVTGERFFDALVANLAKSLNTHSAWATEYLETSQQLRALAFWADGRWDDSADDKRCIGWSRDFFKASAPYASAGAYVNFMTEDEADRIAAAYGSNFERLAQIKRKHDPGNIFHLNQNIKP